MAVRTGWIISLLTAVLSVMPLFGDELDNYSKTLDRVENGFWNAAFTKTPSTREKCFGIVVQFISEQRHHTQYRCQQ